jgi:hypothetical protein
MPPAFLQKLRASVSGTITLGTHDHRGAAVGHTLGQLVVGADCYAAAGGYRGHLAVVVIADGFSMSSP